VATSLYYEARAEGKARVRVRVRVRVMVRCAPACVTIEGILLVRGMK
jgi:hypothetical protein